MAHTFQQEYMEMPPITRAYTTACVLTTIAVVSFYYLFFLLQQNLFSNQLNCQFFKQKNILTRVTPIVRSLTKPQHFSFHFVVGMKQAVSCQSDWLLSILSVFSFFFYVCPRVSETKTISQYDLACTYDSIMLIHLYYLLILLDIRIGLIFGLTSC